MCFYKHVSLLRKTTRLNVDLTAKHLTTSTSRRTNGFISSTGILALFVTALLLASIVILVSQTWQDKIRDDNIAEDITVSQQDIAKNIQQQKSLQELQKNLKTNAVITLDDTTGTVSEADAVVVNEQIPEIQLEPTTDTVTSADNKSLALAFKGGPAIYNQTISGRVLTSAGDILPGIVVTASRQSQQRDAGELLNYVADAAMRRLQVQSNPKGEFGFEQLQPGLYRISAHLQDGDVRSSLMVQSGVKMVGLVMPVLHPAEITGQVADEFGIPLEGVSVRLVPGRARAHSDAQGKFILSDSFSDDQSYQIKFERTDYEPTYLNVSGASLMDNDLPSQISAKMNSITGVTTITGRITDIKGNLLSGQRVRLISPKTNTRKLEFTNQYGEFRFEQVIAGSDYRLGVSPDEKYRPWIQKDIEVTPASQYFELVLEHMTDTGTIEGHIVDPSGNPVPNFSLIVKTNSVGNRKISVRSDQHGNFLALNVPAGEVILQTTAEPEVLLTNLELHPGSTRQVIVPVDWGQQELTGHLVDMSGEPVSGVKVSLHFSQRNGRALSQTRRKSRTDKTGSFRFSNLGDGMHYLSVSGRQIEPVSKEVNVGVDSTVQRIVIRRTST